MHGPTGYVFNRTRQTYLATRLSIADTHWSRFVGLMGARSLSPGSGLWITPCHGVHTFAMRFPIDVAYLDGGKIIVHMAHALNPWRVAAVSMKTASVIELPANTLHSTGTSMGDEVEIGFGKAPGPDSHE